MNTVDFFIMILYNLIKFSEHYSLSTKIGEIFKTMTTHYYLNIEKINSVMKERGINAKQLVDGTNISEKRLKRYLQGKVYKNVPLSVAIIFRKKLDIVFEDFMTETPPIKK